MRNYLLILAVCILLGMAGCAGGESGAQEQIQSGPGSFSKAADDEKQFVQPADVIGEVKSITGNEVVLALIEMPEMPAKQDDAGSAPDGSIPLAEGFVPPDRGERPQMENMTDEELRVMRQKMEARAEKQPALDVSYTGEERMLTIPVGVTIASRGGAQTSEEMDIADIQKGNVLSIWYQNGDNVENAVIEYVLLMGQSSGSKS